jgi:hypothetical protein
MLRTQFREAGLYALPNGLEFILLKGARDSFLLCSPEEKAEESLVDYQLSRDGRIYYQGTRTNWGIGDLTDTGKTIERLIKKVSTKVR